MIPAGIASLLTDEALEEAPLARSKTIPSAWYVHPDFHAFDRDVVMARTWQYVGPAERVRHHGDFMSDIIAGNPIVVIRDKEGELQAYFNVCKHRGGPLAMEECGHSKVLQCKYHGWTYLLDGSLRGVPRFDRTELFDKKDFGLDAVAVREWQGMIFCCLEPEKAPPFDEVIDGIVERIAPLEMASLDFHQRDRYDVRANWKVYVDNYLEGYHIPSCIRTCATSWTSDPTRPTSCSTTRCSTVLSGMMTTSTALPTSRPTITSSTPTSC